MNKMKIDPLNCEELTVKEQIELLENELTKTENKISMYELISENQELCYIQKQVDSKIQKLKNMTDAIKMSIIVLNASVEDEDNGGGSDDSEM